MRILVLTLFTILIAGCAKFPNTGTIGATKRLLVRMTVNGQLRTGVGGSGLPYVYVVAINPSTEATPTTAGPIPIVIPAGNGIVDGTVTHFILWNPLSSPQYQIYKFRDATLNEYFPTGIPVNFTPTNQGDREIAFEIDLSQIVPAADVPNLQSVQLNFLSMNNINTSGGGRQWDAHGDANQITQINSPVTIRLNSSQTYTNQTQIIREPQGDTADPDLDIIDWSVEVRIQ